MSGCLHWVAVSAKLILSEGKAERDTGTVAGVIKNKMLINAINWYTDECKGSGGEMDGQQWRNWRFVCVCVCWGSLVTNHFRARRRERHTAPSGPAVHFLMSAHMRANTHTRTHTWTCNLPHPHPPASFNNLQTEYSHRFMGAWIAHGHARSHKKWCHKVPYSTFKCQIEHNAFR